VVEDLGSTNGTLLNRNEVHGRAALATGDELVMGVTVMQLRSAQDVARQPSAVRAVPPALAAPVRRPTYIDAPSGEGAADSGVPELERLRDRRTKSKATVAPLAIFVLAALAIIIYLGVS
jgi:pSer/pThr/pTyr-binding forkhead associated (FHA) protein